MGKSRAEIQKAYRERKKAKEGESYLEKERKRRMKYYVPSSELSETARKRRNVENRDRVSRHRQKRRTEAIGEAAPNVLSPGDSSGYETASTASTSADPLIVRMNFRRRTGTRKRISRALSKAHREIKHVQSKYQSLLKRHRTLQRQKQRQRQRASIPPSPRTPRSQANVDIKKAGLSTSQGNKIRRQLVLGNALLAELRDTKKEIGRKKGRVDLLKSIICGKIIKKYRGLKWLSSRTGVGKNRIGRTGKKWVEVKKQKRIRMEQKLVNEVTTFYERDDVSRPQPGKADAKKTENGSKIQTRVLTDYLSNLHSKFLSENPSFRISLATFCRLRPKYILLTRFISRTSCLCTKHQNMALVLKALKREGVNVSTNPENYIKNEPPTTEQFEESLHDTFKYGQWKRVTVIEKGKPKNVMRIVETEVARDTFLESFKSQTLEFQEHVRRVKTQYDEMRRLKENLPEHHFILHMDFAENFNCKSVDEIQSAYWNQSVTLHPIVAYYRNNGELSHKSFVIVSDELSHSSTTVHAILDTIIPQISSLDPNVQMIHYWTDGPTSQYRNKQIFYTVANHQQIYGMKARWNYFEVGHGKGPCDGLGGTAKRMADEAIRSGKAVIQDAVDFFKWASNSSMKAVTFLFVPSEACRQVSDVLASRAVTPLRGTFKLHAVVGLGDLKVAYKETSCYCQNCMVDDLCSGWMTQQLQQLPTVTKSHKKQHERQQNSIESEVIPDSAVNPNMTENVNVAVVEGDYVAAIYENKSYVGKVYQVDEEDGEVEITSMETKKQLYQWPTREDILWIPHRDILCKLSDPVATGKSRRMFKMNSEEMAQVLNLVASRSHN